MASTSWEMFVDFFQIYGNLVTNILTIIFNVFLVDVICRRRELRSNTFILLANQAVSDILFATFDSFLYFTCAQIMIKYRFTQLFCESNYVIMALGFQSSVWFLAAVAYDRFTGLYFPRNGSVNVKPIVITIWAAIFLLMFSFFIDHQMLSYFGQAVVQSDCFQGLPELAENWLVQSELSHKVPIFLTNFLPAVFVGSLCTAIIIKLKSLRTVGNKTSEQLTARQQRKEKVIKMLLFIILVYYLFTAPISLLFMSSLFTSKRKTNGCAVKLLSKSVTRWLRILSFTSRFAGFSNPIILCYFNQIFKSEMKSILSHLFTKSSQRKNSASTTISFEKDTSDDCESAACDSFAWDCKIQC
ncbi:putative G-protein coupled receptor 83 [Halotydeus destructor]|nr:putative G-protein coupled receptor 83 [Halotydeus destructor]